MLIKVGRRPRVVNLVLTILAYSRENVLFFFFFFFFFFFIASGEMFRSGCTSLHFYQGTATVFIDFSDRQPLQTV